MTPRLIVLIGMAVLCAQPGAAQTLVLNGDSGARLAWLRIFASPQDDWINDIVPISGRRYLAVGFLGRSDGVAAPDWRALAVALRADGTILRQRTYGQAGGIDAFWSARESPDGRLTFAGFTTRIGAGGIDAWVLNAAPDGRLLRERAFGGAGYDRFTSLAPAGDGFVFVGHSQRPGEDRRRLYAVRTDREGAPVWERVIESETSLGGLYVEPMPDGGFVLSGGIEQDGHDDIIVLKLDAEGREQWRRILGAPEAEDTNHGLAVLPNGNIVVTGYSQSWGARGNDIFAATLSPEGAVLRQAMIGGADDDRPILAKADAQGRVWVVGYTRSAGAGGWDLIFVRLDAAGAFEPGAITLGAAGDDQGTAVRPLADGSVLVGGYSDALGGGGQDAFVARITAPSFAHARPDFDARIIR